LVTNSQTWAVAFNPDGRSLAFATSNGVAFWDLSTHRRFGEPLPVNVQGVGHALAFSPDGSVLATTLADHGLQLWNVSARQPLGSLLETSSTPAVAFSQDGGALAAGGITTTVWDLRVDAWIEDACAIANRELTHSEWDTYVGADVPYRETCASKIPSSP
jgi:WD40 repeat protein